MPDNFIYQTIQVNLPSGNNSRFDPAQTKIGVQVRFLQKAVIFLNSLALSQRIEQEIQRISSQIEGRMPKSGGVLLCIGLQEWGMPDPTGQKLQTFLELHIAGTGIDYRSVLNNYLNTPRIKQGAPIGWRRKDQFIWVTK